jgi:phospholipase C
VDGALDRDHNRLTVRFEAKTDVFGARAAGSPFIAYAFTATGVEVRHYAVAAGGRLEDSWPLAAFDGGRYHLRVHGPNGFFRAFLGSAGDPALDLRLEYARARPTGPALTGDVALRVHNRGARDRTVTVTDRGYGTADLKRTLAPGERVALAVDARRSFGWYDLEVRYPDVPGFEKRYAGRVETGRWGYSDPAMGG